jgi:hypothetical protein
MAEPKYGNFSGHGSRYKEYPDRPPEAWVLNEAQTAWHEVNSPEHSLDVREMTKEEFERRFPDAPPLPSKAFSAP